MSITSQEIYEEIAAKFDAALAAGTVPWQKPWVGELSAPRNLQSGKRYRGINALLLGFSGYSDPRWTTFNAAKKMGGKVVKGEKSTLVTLWKRIKTKDDAGDDKVIPILRYFRVFNVEQVEWPEGAIQPLKEQEQPEGWDGNAEAENVLQDYLSRALGLGLSYGGSSAYYEPARHRIKLPVPGDFWNAAGFYGVAFHEAGHSTGHKTLLNRELSGAFGSEKYAREELCAEMASAFVCATIGIDGEFDNSAAYIANWRQRIKDDPKLLVKAAGAAQKASDLILGQVVEYPEPEAAVELDKTAAIV